MESWPWLLSGKEFLEVIPIHRKPENISIEIFDDVLIKYNDFLYLIRTNPQGFKLSIHGWFLFVLLISLTVGV